MTLRASRCRAMQAALATAAAVTLPRAAEPAAPTTSGDATITAAQVQAALDGLDALIEDGMTKTAVPGTAVAVVHNDTVVYERGFGVRERDRHATIAKHPDERAIPGKMLLRYGMPAACRYRGLARGSRIRRARRRVTGSHYYLSFAKRGYLHRHFCF
jgi:hypothetical protein